MACCSIVQKNFANASSTNIAYIGDTRPKVKVVYLDPGTGIWGYHNPMTRVEITAGNVLVDHGGPATGIIQLIQ